MSTRRLAAAVALSLILAGPALADGKAMAFNRIQWEPLAEKEQRAVIICQDGVQHMVLAVNLELKEEASEAVWIFPVPGQPATVKVRLVDQFPSLSGENVLTRARERIARFRDLLLSSQLLCIPVLGTKVSQAFGSLGGEPVEVLRADRYGLACRLLEARSLEALASYFSAEGVQMPATHLAGFEPYLDGKHLLVATWLKSAQQAKEHFGAASGRRHLDQTPCVYVEFPAATPYFPMRPTASYGSVVVPLWLQILGDYVPDPSTARLSGLRFEYLIGESHYLADHMIDVSSDLAGFIAKVPKRPYAFTEIRNRGQPAQLFTTDLQFEPGAPSEVRMARWIVAEPGDSLFRPGSVGSMFLAYLVVGGALSYLCSGAVGLLVARRWNPYAWVGLASLLTVVAYFFAVRHVIYRGTASDQVTGSAASKWGVVLLFMMFFCLSTIGLEWVLQEWLSSR